MQPLNSGQWLGNNVACDVASLASPNVYLGYVIRWKPWSNYEQQDSDL